MGRGYFTVSRPARSLRVPTVGIGSLSTDLIDVVFDGVDRALASAQRGARSVHRLLRGPAVEPPGARRWWERHPGVYAFTPPKLTEGRRAIIEELIGSGKLSGSDRPPLP